MRSDLIALCQLLPEKDPSNSNLLVEDEFDVTYLQELDARRKELFTKWLQDERDRGDRESSSLIKGIPFHEESIERPTLCNGPKRLYAISEDSALAVIRLDWRKSGNELKAAFARLLSQHPDHKAGRAKKQSKGGRGGPLDQLKKLGARRMRVYCGSPEAAIEAIDLACYDAKIKSPYTDADALRIASAEAVKILKEFESAGRFRSLADL